MVHPQPKRVWDGIVGAGRQAGRRFIFTFQIMNPTMVKGRDALSYSMRDSTQAISTDDVASFQSAGQYSQLSVEILG